MLLNISASIKNLHIWSQNSNEKVLNLDVNDNEETITLLEKRTLDFCNPFSKDDLAQIISVIRENIEIKKGINNHTLVELENRIKSHNNSFLNRILGSKIVPLQTIQDELTFIASSVKNHLKPYQDGKITPKSDPKKRASLISQITRRFFYQFPATELQQENVQKQAFEEYVFEGIRGYQKIIGKKITHQDPLYDQYVVKLVIAFKNAFQQDFPKYEVIPEDTYELVKRGIRLVNDDISLSFQELEALRFNEQLHRLVEMYPRFTNTPFTQETAKTIASSIPLSELQKEFPDYENCPKTIEELVERINLHPLRHLNTK